MQHMGCVNSFSLLASVYAAQEKVSGSDGVMVSQLPPRVILVAKIPRISLSGDHTKGIG